MMSNAQAFQPNWASPPGETILDILSEKNVSKFDFAIQIGCDIEYANCLFNGTKEISEEVAFQLSEIVGASPSFWLTREQQYREDIARIYREISADEENWLGKIPVTSMQGFGWIPKADCKSRKLLNCLDFFGVPNVLAWEEQSRSDFHGAKFRSSSSFAKGIGSTSAWIRQGEIMAEQIDCQPWDKEKLKENLGAIIQLTLEASPLVFVPELQRICANSGVAVVAARTPEGCPASGVTKFISSGKALLLLSFRYLSDDHFWFTVFHEIAHLILHDEASIYIEGGEFDHGAQEAEANEFAQNTLIPPHLRGEMLSLPLNYRSILKFSRRLGVSPGIIVGQLQHNKIIENKHMNRLKVRYAWEEMNF